VHPDQPPPALVGDAAIASLAAVIQRVAPTHPSPVRRLATKLLGG